MGRRDSERVIPRGATEREKGDGRQKALRRGSYGPRGRVIECGVIGAFAGGAKHVNSPNDVVGNVVAAHFADLGNEK